MHSLSELFTKNPVAANLLMALVILMGFFTLKTIRIEGFPAIPASSITVSTVYPGASTDQVDRGVTRKIEKALSGMPGVKRITSYSENGISSVTVTKESKVKLDRFQNEIRTRIDSNTTLPGKAEKPVITRDEFTIEALIVQVYGDTDKATLQKVARNLREELQSHPQITRISSFGIDPYEVRIEVDNEKLRSLDLSLDDIASAVDRGSLDYRTGNLRSESGTVVIKADKKAFNYNDFSSIPVKTLPDGTRILLKDTAEIVDGFSELDYIARFQGKPSVGIQLYTSKKGHLLQVSRAANSIVQKFKDQLPEGVYMETWGDSSEYMKARLNLLKENALQGLIIVFLLLALFLNFKLAFWVAMGIPVSIAGTLVLMSDRFLGYSLNDITTFGMIIVLGILVDDAIVVGESVYEQRNLMKDPVEAAVKGVNKVSTATIFGCFTTVAAFYPLLLIDNEIGKLFASFSVVVIVSLFVSLLESKLILPAHLAGIKIKGSEENYAEYISPERRNIAKRIYFHITSWWEKIQNFCSAMLSYINNKLYQPSLKTVLKHRYTAMVVLVAVVISVLSMVFNGWIRVVFFPEVPGQHIVVNMRMKNGSPAKLTTENLDIIEREARELNEHLMDEFKTDEPPIMRIMSYVDGPLNVLIYAELQSEKKRKIGTLDVLKRWRERIGILEGVEDLHITGTYQTGGGFTVQLSSRNSVSLEAAVEMFTHEFRKLDGIHDVRDNLREGSPQIKLTLKDEAQHLGLTNSDLARQIGDAFGGLEISRLQRGTDEVRVFVKYNEERRRYIHDIMETKIRTNSGEWVPLSMVAAIESGYTPSFIYRENGRRVAEVQASLDKEIISSAEAYKWIEKEIIPEITSKYPEVDIRGSGEIEEMGDMKDKMKYALILILILIYALLAVPLKSYLQPFVIMSVIPFGFVGAVIGHWITGFPLSVLSFFGMLAVMGVVVNDSIVMLTRFNELKAEGEELSTALLMAGGSRFRAIILTTITTACGLIPLLSESSEQAQYLIPAAVSLAYGVLFATPVTLYIVPVLMNITDDARGRFKKIINKSLSYIR